MSRNHGKHERTEAKGTGGTSTGPVSEGARKRVVYVVQGQVESVTPNSGAYGPWSGSRGVPTFVLDSSVQGIMSESHALTIARTVVDPLGVIPSDRIHLSIVREEW